MPNSQTHTSASKRNHFSAFLHGKCPRCHHGEMFTNKNPYALKHMSKMATHCSTCGLSFFPETGFYWGAMYVSYLLTVCFSFISVLVIGFISHWNLYALIIGNAILLALGFPLFFRYARILWLYLNVSFSREAYELAKSRLN